MLHNAACAYQKVWELEECSNYLEALIYNINIYMNETERSTVADSKRKVKGKSADEGQGIETTAMKTLLTRYYLQYCAINSQKGNHSGALVAGRKSIENIKQIFRDIAYISPTLKKMTYEKKSEFEYRLRLIDLGCRINDGFTVAQYETVFLAAKHYLRQWKAIKDTRDRADRNYVLEE